MLKGLNLQVHGGEKVSSQVTKSGNKMSDRNAFLQAVQMGEGIPAFSALWLSPVTFLAWKETTFFASLSLFGEICFLVIRLKVLGFVCW